MGAKQRKKQAKEKKKAEKKVQQQRRSELKRAKAQTSKVLRKLWAHQAPPATRGKPTVAARSAWRGMPVEKSEDTLRLSGMQHVHLWYPNQYDYEHWLNEYEVSSIELHELLDVTPAQDNGQYYRYGARLLQLLDPETDYGRLRKQQQHTGTFPEEEHFEVASERRIEVILHVATPSRQIAKSFRQANAAPPILHLVDFPCFVRPLDPSDTRPRIEQLKANSLVDAMSDLEVDRAWEFFLALNDWLIDPVESSAQRTARKRSIKTKLDAASKELQGVEEAALQAQNALQRSQEVFAAANKQFQQARSALENAEAEHRRNIATLSREKLRLENECSRLRGVRLETLRKVQSLNGTDSENLAKLEEKIAHIQSQESAIPEKLTLVEGRKDQELARWSNAQVHLRAAVSTHTPLRERAANALASAQQEVTAQSDTLQQHLQAIKTLESKLGLYCS